MDNALAIVHYCHKDATQERDADRVSQWPMAHNTGLLPEVAGLQQECDNTSSNGTDADKHSVGTTKEWLWGRGRCSRIEAGGRVVASGANKLKVGAGKTGGVRAVDVDGAVSKEASQTGLGRHVKVRISRESCVNVLIENGYFMGTGALTERRMGSQ